MGAAIMMKSHPQSVEHEAMVAFGGPVLGTAGAMAVAAAAASTDSQLFYALADFGLMINLFNLVSLHWWARRCDCTHQRIMAACLTGRQRMHGGWFYLLANSNLMVISACVLCSPT
jgi:hypothetical protein